MSSYYYLDVSLEIENNKENVTAVHLKKHIMQSLKQLFGETSKCVQVDVLKFNDCRAILRAPEDIYVKLHSALTLTGFYAENLCVYTVHKTGTVLLNLGCDSREFKH